MDGKWIEVDPQDYVVPFPDAPSECILFILPVNMPINIFGMPLFVDYYTIHDPETGTIDFAPHTSSTKTTLLTTPLNTKRLLKIQAGPSAEETNKAVVYISWGVIALLTYVIIDYWARQWLPNWLDEYDSFFVITFSVLLVLGVVLFAVLAL